MELLVTIAFLLVFCIISLALSYNAGYRKGANEVLDEWRTWLNDVKE